MYLYSFTKIMNQTIVQHLTRWMKKSSILFNGVEGGGGRGAFYGRFGAPLKDGRTDVRKEGRGCGAVGLHIAKGSELAKSLSVRGNRSNT